MFKTGLWIGLESKYLRSRVQLHAIREAQSWPLSAFAFAFSLLIDYHTTMIYHHHQNPKKKD